MATFDPTIPYPTEPLPQKDKELPNVDDILGSLSQEELKAYLSEDFAQSVLNFQAKRNAEAEARRIESLSRAEAEELAKIPRGTMGAVTRAQVQAKYHNLRVKADDLKEPEPDAGLVRDYQREVAAVKGNIYEVSQVQAKYRRLGLKV